MQEDFDGDKSFNEVKTTRDFYLQVGALFGGELNSVEDTIIFLAEIQVYLHLLSLLKPLKKRIDIDISLVVLCWSLH